MPWTLYRYILADLLRIIGLTTAVLVTVIAFGAAIKPLANDRLLSAAQTAKYIGLVIVPMLQFALPFAAGFGATLSFHRLTADNEIQAMSASGISYRRILAPVLVLGVSLTILMVVLTQFVIPRFWSMTVHTIARDVTRLFQMSVERGEAFEMNQMQIFAQEMIVQESPEGADGPATRMILLNVAAADLDEDGKIVTDVTAARAIVDVYRRGSQTFLKMVMTDTVALNAQTGQLVYAEQFAPRRAVVIASSISNSLKPVTLRRMLELRRNPDLHPPVARAREALLDALVDSELRQSINVQLSARGQIELRDVTGAAPGERTYAVLASRIGEGGRFFAGEGRRVEVVQYDNGVPSSRLISQSVHLGTTHSQDSAAMTHQIILDEHEVINLLHAGGAINKRGRLVIPSLGMQHAIDEDLYVLSSAELIEAVKDLAATRPQVRERIAELNEEIQDMNWEMTARTMNRYAVSMTAVLLLLLGSLMPMWHRGGTPLVIYVWAFVPAVLDLILISGGEQLLQDGLLWGHMVMWSGNAAMVLLCVITYFRIVRN